MREEFSKLEAAGEDGASGAATVHYVVTLPKLMLAYFVLNCRCEKSSAS
jgi:hypothetical protein